MESPAPTDRMPKNSRMNNYFLIGGWQRKSGITNFPKFCIELHSSLRTLPAAGGQDTDRKSVAKKCSEQPAAAQPSPAQPRPAQPAQHLTYKLCTNPPPGRLLADNSSNMLPGVSQPCLPPPICSVGWIFVLMMMPMERAATIFKTNF